MRLREALTIAVLAAFASSACDRLTFIRPNARIKNQEQVKQPPQAHDNAEVKRQLAMQEALALASNRLQSGDYDEAGKQARKVLAVDHTSAGAYTILALVAQQRNDDAQAGSYFKQATEQPSSGPAEWANYGTWLCGNGRYVESLVWLDRALVYRDQVDVAGTLANTGKCAFRAGQNERAERDLRASLGLSAENPVALDGMADLTMQRGQYLEARAFSERRLAIGATAEGLRRAALIESRLGDVAAAQRYVARLRQEFPNASSTGQ